MKKGVLFKTARVVIVLTLSILIAGVLLKMRPRAERREPVDTGRLVEVLTAKAGDLNMGVETYGTVRPREELKLAAEVRGRVVALHPMFEEGLAVEKGATLVRIDPRTYRMEEERLQVQKSQIEAEMLRLAQEVRNLEASIRISNSDVQLAKAEFHRLKALSKRKVTPQTTLDKAEQRYLNSLERLQGLENQMALTGPAMKQLEARLKATEMMRRQAALNLERTKITAPFDGWVLDKAAEVGRHVAVGQYLGSIYRDGAFDVEIRIPAEDLQWLPDRFAPGQGPAADVVFRGGGAKIQWQGRVARVKAGMDEKTRTLPFVVQVDVPADELAQQRVVKLRPGLFVTVRLQGKPVEDVFVLPRHLVYEDDVLYLADEDRLRSQTVNVIRRFKDRVYVNRGLTDGDLVIKTPLGSVVDGMKIRIRK